VNHTFMSILGTGGLGENRVLVQGTFLKGLLPFQWYQVAVPGVVTWDGLERCNIPAPL